MPDKQTIDRARKNGASGNQFVPPGGRPSNVDDVISLLEGASETAHQGVRRACSIVLERMADQPWAVTAGRHAGGHGGAGREPDFNDHITLRVGGRGYHLHLTRDGFLRRITGDNGVDLVRPWLPPGAPISE